jgi:hypothetical protein
MPRRMAYPVDDRVRERQALRSARGMLGTWRATGTIKRLLSTASPVWDHRNVDSSKEVLRSPPGYELPSRIRWTQFRCINPTLEKHAEELQLFCAPIPRAAKPYHTCHCQSPVQ